MKTRTLQRTLLLSCAPLQDCAAPLHWTRGLLDVVNIAACLSIVDEQVYLWFQTFLLWELFVFAREDKLFFLGMRSEGETPFGKQYELEAKEEISVLHEKVDLCSMLSETVERLERKDFETTRVTFSRRTSNFPPTFASSLPSCASQVGKELPCTCVSDSLKPPIPNEESNTGNSLAPLSSKHQSEESFASVPNSGESFYETNQHQDPRTNQRRDEPRGGYDNFRSHLKIFFYLVMRAFSSSFQRLRQIDSPFSVLKISLQLLARYSCDLAWSWQTSLQKNLRRFLLAMFVCLKRILFVSRSRVEAFVHTAADLVSSSSTLHNR